MILLNKRLRLGLCNKAVCPYTLSSDEYMLDKLKSCYNFFNDNGYNVISALNEESNGWINLESLEPDILFFNNPHYLTRKEYFEDAYKKYLSCYSAYHYEVGLYANNQPQYNADFHNYMWKIFAPHTCSYDTYKKTSIRRAGNVEITGYPFIDSLTKTDLNNNGVWNNNDERLRIIWAPHHTIDSPELPYSNFLKCANLFKDIALKYQDKIFWSFKPHPILRCKLELDQNWGKDKTDEFYNFWASSDFSQLNEGDYVDLFRGSDAMIHDCGSFLAEYLHLNKPVLYMLATENYMDYYNDFGHEALKSCYLGKNFSDVEYFINQILDNKIRPKSTDFLTKGLNTYSPSNKIFDILSGVIK